MKYTKLVTAFFALFMLVNAQTMAEDDHDYSKNSHSEEPNKNHDDHDEDEDHADEDSHGKKAEHDNHNEESEDSHDEKESGIEINQSKRTEAGIKIEPIALQTIAETIRVPAEIKINGYRSQVITPRISSMVIERHVVLGDHVKANQPLATLFSVDVAEAQGNFIMAAKEWERVKKLGKKVVSEKRFIEAEVTYQQASARLQAYGMAESEIGGLLKVNKNHKPGNFTLFSDQSGIITSDDFRSGEIIDPGRTIFDVVDERVLWVEAHVSPEYSGEIKKGSNAWVHSRGSIIPAIVAQKSYVLDATTRTLTIRLEVNNEDHFLSPRQFVDVEIEAGNGEDVLAVPSAAILRGGDGDTQVFVEDSTGKLVAVEVEVVRTAGERKVIEGIPIGTKVVTQGAFFIQSEIAKGGFDIHNH